MSSAHRSHENNPESIRRESRIFLCSIAFSRAVSEQLLWSSFYRRNHFRIDRRRVSPKRSPQKETRTGKNQRKIRQHWNESPGWCNLLKAADTRMWSTSTLSNHASHLTVTRGNCRSWSNSLAYICIGGATFGSLGISRHSVGCRCLRHLSLSLFLSLSSSLSLSRSSYIPNRTRNV